MLIDHASMSSELQPMQPRRLDQVLSRYGYCSRREARRWVSAGRVTVGGDRVTAVDAKVDPERVTVDGEPLEHPRGLLVLLHKPAGYVCSLDAREGPRVYDLLPPRWLERNPPIASVGRLDKDTTGALLLTDQGAWIQRWTSPRHHVPKVYAVRVDRDLSGDLIDRFAAGTMRLDGEDACCRPAKLTLTGARTAVVELTEGKYHQVKRMFGACGYGVCQLHRQTFAQFGVEDLPVGGWRHLPLTLNPLGVSAGD
jgi:16S rRNA pseudouridine516 synthase